MSSVTAAILQMRKLGLGRSIRSSSATKTPQTESPALPISTAHVTCSAPRAACYRQSAELLTVTGFQVPRRLPSVSRHIPRQGLDNRKCGRPCTSAKTPSTWQGRLWAPTPARVPEGPKTTNTFLPSHLGKNDSLAQASKGQSQLQEHKREADTRASGRGWDLA